MIKKIVAIAILGLLCIGGRFTPADASTDISVTLHPEQIMIGAAFDGEHVSVAGRIPSDASALIRITGKAEHNNLKQKGRALGILWMNLGSVEISKAPNVFLLYLSPEGNPGSQAEEASWRNLGVGLEGLRKQVDIVSGEEDKNALFDEFVKLKHKSGLYATVENAIHYGEDDGKTKAFNATVTLPASLPQGTYKFELLAVKDGAVEASVIRKIDAREVGMPAWISKLAFDHGTLYGVLAVLVAVIAGLLTGVMFKGEKGAH